MDLHFTDTDLAFRDEVRAFLDASLTEDLREAQRKTPTVFVEYDISVRWQKILHRQGWGAPNWPREYGGPGWSLTQLYIFGQECARADAPQPSPSGTQLVGPVLMQYGSDWQKQTFLPRILNGDDYWCQGYSEPGSGSDLASLKCKAVADGDDYIVNGTKIWTTHAHYANWIFCLVRTDDSGRKQQGITFLLIPMDSPGISVRPILTIGGDHELNQVFFDDVRVPQSYRVGAEGQGWEIAKYLLEWERGGTLFAARLRRKVDHLRQVAGIEVDGGQPILADPVFANKLAALEIDLTALEFTELRIMAALDAGGSTGPMSSVIKLRTAQLTQDIAELGVEALGYGALPWDPARPLYNRNEPAIGPEHGIGMVPAHLNARAYTIFGGSAEIQKDILAKMLLGL